MRRLLPCLARLKSTLLKAKLGSAVPTTPPSAPRYPLRNAPLTSTLSTVAMQSATWRKMATLARAMAAAKVMAGSGVRGGGGSGAGQAVDAQAHLDGAAGVGGSLDGDAHGALAAGGLVDHLVGGVPVEDVADADGQRAGLGDGDDALGDEGAGGAADGVDRGHAEEGGAEEEAGAGGHGGARVQGEDVALLNVGDHVETLQVVAGRSGADVLVEAAEVDGLGGEVFAALVGDAVDLEADFALDDGALGAVEEAVLHRVDGAAVGGQIPGRGAAGVEDGFDDGLQRGAATGAEFVDRGRRGRGVVGAGVLVRQGFLRGRHDEVGRREVQLFALQALLQPHHGAADAQRRDADGSARAGEVGVPAGGGDGGGVEQVAGVRQRGVGREDGVDGAVLQARGAVAEGADEAVEAAQVVIDERLAREADDAAVGDHRIGLFAVGHGAVLEFAVLVGLQQVRRTGQVDDGHGLEVRRVGRAAGPAGVAGHVLHVALAQPLVGHVGEQVGEVAGAHHAAGAVMHDLRGQLQAAHAAGVDAAALEVLAADLHQAHAAELAAVVRQRGLGVDAVVDGLGDAGEAGLHLVLHGLDAAHVEVAATGGVALGQLLEHGGAGLVDGLAVADEASGQVGHVVAGAQVSDVGSALQGSVGSGLGGSIGGGALGGFSRSAGGSFLLALGLEFCFAHGGFLVGLRIRAPEFARHAVHGLRSGLRHVAGAAAGVGVGAHGAEGQLHRRPADGSVKRQVDAVGAVLRAGDLVFLDRVPERHGADDSGLDVADDALLGGVGAAGAAGAAFAAADPALAGDAEDGADAAVGVVAVAHLHGAGLEASHVHRLGCDGKLFFVDLVIEPVIRAAAAAGGPDDFEAVVGLAPGGGLELRDAGLRRHVVQRGALGAGGCGGDGLSHEARWCGSRCLKSRKLETICSPTGRAARAGSAAAAGGAGGGPTLPAPARRWWAAASR